MKRLAAIAAILAGVALPACAQHGGAHGGGFSGGHGASSFHSSSEFHSGLRPSAPMGSRVTPSRTTPNYAGRYPGSRGYAPGNAIYRSPGYRNPGYRPDYRSGRPPYAPANRAPTNRSAINGNHRYPYRPPYRSPFRTRFILPFGWAGYAPWLGLGYWDSSDAYASDYDDAQSPPYYDGYDPQSPNGQYDGQYPDPQPGYPDQSSSPYQPRPPYQPTPDTSQSSAPLPQQAITLVFRDGRPSEQIYNFMLSRDKITIYDQHPREIAISQLDLAATEQANRQAGVDFRLPILPGN
jgi:hypothetical protein